MELQHSFANKRYSHLHHKQASNLWKKLQTAPPRSIVKREVIATQGEKSRCLSFKTYFARGLTETLSTHYVQNYSFNKSPHPIEMTKNASAPV